MSKLSEFSAGDVLHSKVPLVKIADTTRYYVVEDTYYEGGTTDGYGDYVPPEHTVAVRLLEQDGTYDPDAISAVLKTTWTAGVVRVQDEDGNTKHIADHHLEKLARKMRRVFV